LHEENIATTNVFQDLDRCFAIAEARQLNFAYGLMQVSSDILREYGVGVTPKNHQSAVVHRG
jgi:hypothetical protein